MGPDGAQVDLPVDSTGSIQVDTGRLNLAGGGRQSGSSTVAAGAMFGAFGVSFDFHAASSISGAGSFLVGGWSAGDLVTVAGAFTLTGGIEVIGNCSIAPSTPIPAQPFLTMDIGTCALEADITCTQLHMLDGVLGGAGTVTSTGTSDWSAGILRGPGTTVIAAGATLAIGQPGETGYLSDRTLRVDGTFVVRALYFDGDALLDIGPGGTVQLGTGVSAGCIEWAWPPAGAIVNAGTIIVLSPPGSTFWIEPDLTSTGDIEVQSGVLRVPSGFVQTAGSLHLAGGSVTASAPLTLDGGTLDGQGIVTADLINAGAVVSPGGAAAGTISIQGTFTQGAAGHLAIGIDAAGSSDRLDVTGAATLDGEMQVSLLGGYALTDNDSIVIIDAASRSGDFASMTGPLVAGPLHVMRVLTPTRVLLDVTSKTEQAITFAAPAAKRVGDAAFALTATATSGLPVAFAVVSGPASISGQTLAILGAGTVVVRATQAGDATYAPAPYVDQSFTVSPAVAVHHSGGGHGCGLGGAFGAAAIGSAMALRSAGGGRRQRTCST